MCELDRKVKTADRNLSNPHHAVHDQQTDHTKIEELLRITTLNPIMSTIKRKVLKLYGHVKISEVGFSRQCLEGMVEGKRNRGRPQKR